MKAPKSGNTYSYVEPLTPMAMAVWNNIITPLYNTLKINIQHAKYNNLENFAVKNLLKAIGSSDEYTQNKMCDAWQKLVVAAGDNEVFCIPEIIRHCYDHKNKQFDTDTFALYYSFLKEQTNNFSKEATIECFNILDTVSKNCWNNGSFDKDLFELVKIFNGNSSTIYSFLYFTERDKTTNEIIFTNQDKHYCYDIVKDFNTQLRQRFSEDLVNRMTTKDELGHIKSYNAELIAFANRFASKHPEWENCSSILSMLISDKKVNSVGINFVETLIRKGYNGSEISKLLSAAKDPQKHQIMDNSQGSDRCDTILSLLDRNEMVKLGYDLENVDFNKFEETLLSISQNTNLIKPSQIVNPKALPTINLGPEYNNASVKYLDLTSTDTLNNLEIFGFAPGTTKANLRLLVHMFNGIASDATCLEELMGALTNPGSRGVTLSTSFVNPQNSGITFGQDIGVIVSPRDIFSVPAALNDTYHSGTKKKDRDYVDWLFGNVTDDGVLVEEKNKHEAISKII
ncbi:MAG: hypothetical protein NC191_05105 [Muribaculaceae bacterium]|nr:hypothetical protein [Muribaculaceae bacterium]